MSTLAAADIATTMVGGRADGVARAAAALIALGSDEALREGGLGVLRIAELTGGDKGQVSRLLTTLTEYGLVERGGPDRSYRLGWQVFALAARGGGQRLLVAARPLLHRLVEELGERANLSVLQGTDVLTVYSEPSPRAVQSTGWVGRTVPSYCTSSGRALLLDHRREELAAMFAGVDFQPVAPNSPPDVASLFRRIVASRARGFALVQDEFEPGLVAAAAPVRGPDGRICAAVNVSAPKFRLGGGRRLAAAAAALKAAADELSATLGYGAARPRPAGGRR